MGFPPDIKHKMQQCTRCGRLDYLSMRWICRECGWKDNVERYKEVGLALPIELKAAFMDGWEKCR